MAFYFFSTPAWLPRLFSGWTWRIPTGKEKVIYLTFDDGPMPGPTDFVLDQLKSAQAKATFFCIGDNVRKHPDTLRKVLDAGHRLGNHTFHHVRGWGISTEDYLSNVDRCVEVLAGSPTLLFRPPYGKITLRQAAALKRRGFRIVMWDVLTYDFQAGLKTGDALQRIRKATRPGSIVVFHDSLKAEPQLRILLPAYLDFLRSEGYVMRALPA